MHVIPLSITIAYHSIVLTPIDTFKVMREVMFTYVCIHGGIKPLHPCKRGFFPCD
jgi:hypothetical protein